MFSATWAALRRSRSKSMRQMSGGGLPSHSPGESESCTRYSEMCERNLIRGADSAKPFNTVQVSSSRQTPTTESGSLVEKRSRGELLAASLMDIGFISNSGLAGRYFRYCFPVGAIAQACRDQNRGCPRI